MIKVTEKRRAFALGDRGSASIWVLGVGLSVVLLAALAALAGSAVVARHKAGVVADLAALAGAAVAADGAPAACGRAEAIVRAQQARLVGCLLEALDILVTVEIDNPCWPAAARARARAGPVRRESLSHAVYPKDSTSAVRPISPALTWVVSVAGTRGRWLDAGGGLVRSSH